MARRGAGAWTSGPEGRDRGIRRGSCRRPARYRRGLRGRRGYSRHTCRRRARRSRADLQQQSPAVRVSGIHTGLDEEYADPSLDELLLDELQGLVGPAVESVGGEDQEDAEGGPCHGGAEPIQADPAGLGAADSMVEEDELARDEDLLEPGRTRRGSGPGPRSSPGTASCSGRRSRRWPGPARAASGRGTRRRADRSRGRTGRGPGSVRPRGASEETVRSLASS